LYGASSDQIEQTNWGVMTYDIVFIEKKDAEAAGGAGKAVGAEKALGDKIFLASLPTSPKVFAFFYPGDADTDEAEKRLRTLGQRTGDNLFINFGTLADPDYKRAVERFGIKPLPVLVVTAISPLAATPDGKSTFVRLDGAALFAQPEALARTVEQLFNLFLAGDVSKAVSVGRWEQGKAAVGSAVERVWELIQPVFAWAATKDIKVGLVDGTLEIKESGAK
jgi:hypothetical protein